VVSAGLTGGRASIQGGAHRGRDERTTAHGGGTLCWSRPSTLRYISCEGTCPNCTASLLRETSRMRSVVAHVGLTAWA